MRFLGSAVLSAVRFEIRAHERGFGHACADWARQPWSGTAEREAASALPPRRQRVVAGEPPFEIVAVATGFLFRFRLMGIGITMFPARVRVVTLVEAISSGAMLTGWSRIPASRIGVHRRLLRFHKQPVCRFTLEIETLVLEFRQNRTSAEGPGLPESPHRTNRLLRHVLAPLNLSCATSLTNEPAYKSTDRG